MKNVLSADASIQIKRLTSLTSIHSIFIEAEILQSPNLIQVILDLLHDPRCSILAQVVHAAQCLENAAPLLWLALHFAPQVLHDHLIILPVVGVVSQHLQLRVCNVPVFIRSCLIQNRFEL